MSDPMAKARPGAKPHPAAPPRSTLDMAMQWARTDGHRLMTLKMPELMTHEEYQALPPSRRDMLVRDYVICAYEIVSLQGRCLEAPVCEIQREFENAAPQHIRDQMLDMIQRFEGHAYGLGSVDIVRYMRADDANPFELMRNGMMAIPARPPDRYYWQ